MIFLIFFGNTTIYDEEEIRKKVCSFVQKYCDDVCMDLFDEIIHLKQIHVANIPHI